MLNSAIKNITLIMLVSTFLSGCSFSSRMIDVTNDDKFENPYVSFNAPSNNWRIYNRKWRIGTGGNRYYKTIFNDALKNGSLVIEITSKPTKADYLFDKNYDYEDMYNRSQQNPDRIERHREQGITYDKDETQYFQGMKCAGGVFSRNYGGDTYSASSKNYTLYCGYYHKIEGKRLIKFSYRYFGASGVSKLQQQAGMNASDVPSLNEAERVLKEDLKEVLDSMVIKNVDWARMEKEGLIYDKPYKTIKW